MRIVSTVCGLCLLFTARAAVGVGQSDASQTRPKTMAEFVAYMKAEDQKACKDFRGRIEKPENRFDFEAALSGAQIYCTCTPVETACLAAVVKDPATQDQMWAVYDQAYHICSGREKRSVIIAKCPVDPDALPSGVERTAYCGCVASIVSRMDDARLNIEIEQMYEDAVLQANKQREIPPSSEYSVAIRHFGASCEAARK